MSASRFGSNLPMRSTVSPVAKPDQAEIDARDLAIIEAHQGDIADVWLFDPDEWRAAAAEWSDVEL